jgi:hypothetical protein
MLLPFLLSPSPVGTQGGPPPLAIVCPPTAKLFCGESSTDPSVTGSATAVGGCAPVTITFTDIVNTPTTADRFQYEITRVWTASDSCGQTAVCSQEIHVLRQMWYLDIKPTSCPNPINLGGNGVVPVGLLGSAGHDVTQIDPTSIRLSRLKSTGVGSVAPTMVNFADVGTPYTGDLCGCHTLGGDGILDLNLKFDKQALVQALNLANVPNMTFTQIVLTARLYDGCEIIAVDCVRVQ